MIGVAVCLVILVATIYGLYSEEAGNWMIQAMRWHAGMQEKSLQVGDQHMVYLEGGHGDNVLLIHGFAGDKDNWTYLTPYLSSKYHVIAVDLPGFGESTCDPKSSYSVTKQAERLHSFVHALKLSHVNLAGNSMGGLIAGLYAVNYPEDVQSLALIDAGGVKSPVPSKMSVELAYGHNPLVTNSISDFNRVLSFVCYKPPYIPQPVKKVMATKALEHRAFNNKIYNEIHPQIGMLQPSLGRIKAPVLIIWGDHDRVIEPSSMGVFQQGLTGAASVTTVTLKNCGHLPMTEKPEETAAAYLDFLQSSPKALR